MMNLDSKESVQIILKHVIEGIEIARKFNIPERVIDFIRTHHGTSLVYYFYNKDSKLEIKPDRTMNTCMEVLSHFLKKQQLL